jgi:3',5'-cyclic AMP phosphodiesterase CpdA
MLKIIFTILGVSFLILNTIAANNNAVPSKINIPDNVKKEYGLVFEEVNVNIPGIKKNYSFLWISDLHVIAQDISEVAPKSQKVMAYRRDKRFNNPRSKKNPAALWAKLPNILNNSCADGVFLGGDICDTGSIANLKLLKDGLKKLTIPFIYTREDHDITPWHLASKDTTIQRKISKEIDGHKQLHVKEFDDLIVIGLDYSVRRISKKALKEFKAVYARKKPIIIVMHVPIYPKGSKDPLKWITTKKSMWGNPKLQPKEVMGEFLNLISDSQGPVKIILSGHNHNTWDGTLSKGTRHHIFGPAFEGTIGVINVFSKPTK